MIRVLITGMSGTGKSAVVGELANRGYRAVDADDPAHGISEPRSDGEWGWRLEKVEALLDDDRSDDFLFFAGCSDEQVGLYPRFDRVVLLSASKEVIVERLRTRDTNSYGKDPGELENVLTYIDTIEPALRKRAGLEISTVAPLTSVVDQILAFAQPQR